MPRWLDFHNLDAADLTAIEAQPSQAATMGIAGPIDAETAATMVEQPIAWAVRREDRLIACCGIVENFPGRQGIAWCILAAGIGKDHLEMTRFMAHQIACCGLARVELYARAPDLEAVIAARPELDSGQIVTLALTRPTPEMRWATLLGMTPAHLMRCFGAASESYMLFERVDPMALVSAEDEVAHG
jgi:hypothetical protein